MLLCIAFQTFPLRSCCCSDRVEEYWAYIYGKRFLRAILSIVFNIENVFNINPPSILCSAIVSLQLKALQPNSMVLHFQNINSWIKFMVAHILCINVNHLQSMVWQRYFCDALVNSIGLLWRRESAAFSNTCFAQYACTSVPCMVVYTVLLCMWILTSFAPALCWSDVCIL